MRRASGVFKDGDKTRKLAEYLPSEVNMTDEVLGIYMYGPKVGDFMMNSTGIDPDAVTVDLWLARTYNRMIGRLLDVPPKAREKKQITSEVRTKTERNLIKGLIKDLAEENDITPSAMQAALWYFEQRLYRNHGINSESTNFSGAAEIAATKRSIPLPGAEEAVRGTGEPAAGRLQQDPVPEEVDFVGDVIFEVAPDPNNVALSARWNALPAGVQLAISDTVSKSVLPSVLEAAGAEGSVSPQIGSYLDDTNPSFSLRLTSGNPAAVANAVGFVLSQDSMVALAGDAFEGSFEAGAVRIQVGDKSLQEIDAIYQTLRGIEGFPQIGGQSTTDGQMTLILEEGVDVEAFSDAVVSALPSEYSDAVLFDAVNVSFPEKKDYDYGSSENDPRRRERTGSAAVSCCQGSSRPRSRRSNRPIRAKRSRRVQHRLRAADRDRRRLPATR